MAAKFSKKPGRGAVRGVRQSSGGPCVSRVFSRERGQLWCSHGRVFSAREVDVARQMGLV